MISLQRFILVFLTINLIVGFTTSIYKNPSYYTNDQIKAAVGEMETNEQTLKDTNTGGLAGMAWQSILNGMDVLIMPLKVIVTVLGYFVKGLLPFGLSPRDGTTPIEVIIIYTIGWMRSMFWVLIAIEAYMFRMNKKVS